MALIVEDGSIVPGAESYASVAYADAYWAAHGAPSQWSGATTGAKESALRYGTMDVDLKGWSGDIVNVLNQALQLPRSGLLDSRGREYLSNEIPEQVKQSVCERALDHIRGNSVNKVETSGIESVKTGSVEVVFAGGGGVSKSVPYAEMLVSGLRGPKTIKARRT